MIVLPGPSALDSLRIVPVKSRLTARKPSPAIFWSGNTGDGGGARMSLRIPVSVYASDPISRAGVVAQLRSRAEVEVVEQDGGGTAAVAVVVAEEVDETTVQIMKALRRNGCERVVL